MTGAVAMGRQPVRSNAAGQGTFRWLRTSLGAVTIRVTVTTANSRVTFIIHPPVASQGLLAQYPAKTRAAQLRYDSGVAAARMVYHCTAVCNGAPPITIDYGNATQALERLTTSVGGRALGAPVLLKPGRTAHLAYIVHDTNVVVVKVEIRVLGRWTTLVVIGSLRVDCPPLPAAAVMLVCHCTSGDLTVEAPVSPYSLGAFHNTTAHTWAIELRGHKMFYVRPGQTLAPISVPAGAKRLSCDVYVGVINSAGVTTARYIASGTVGQ